MSREAKIIKPGAWDIEQTIHHYESFGWELLSIDRDSLVMSRETQSPVYDTLLKNEAKYQRLIDEYMEMSYPDAPEAHKPFSFGKFLVLFILGVLPDFIYACAKRRQRKRHKKALERYQMMVEIRDGEKQELLERIEQLVLNSRATFYAKQK